MKMNTKTCVVFKELEEMLLRLGHILNVPSKHNAITGIKGGFTPMKFYNFIEYLEMNGHKVRYEMKPFYKTCVYLIETGKEA